MSEKQLEILFVRHGESYGKIRQENLPDFPRGDPPLTETGLHQAELLARRFSAGGIDRIYSSPLIRAVQTAFPSAEKTGIPITLMPELLETDTAVPVGSPAVLAKYLPHMRLFEKEPTAVQLTDAGENDIRRRAADCIRRFLADCPRGSTVLVFSHGTFLSYLIRAALGCGDRDAFSCQEDNCAVTDVLLRKNDRPKLRFANDVSHLGKQIVILQ